MISFLVLSFLPFFVTFESYGQELVIGDTGQLYQSARQDFAARQFADAEIKLQRLLQAEPSNGKARYLLVRSLILNKQSKQALRAAEEGVQLAPQDAYSYVALGDALFREGEFDRAASSYARARVLQPDLARGHLGYGNVMLTQAKRLSARESFRKAYSLDPEDPDIMKCWATVLPRSSEEIALWERFSKEATYLEPEYLQDVGAFTQYCRRKEGHNQTMLRHSAPTVQIPLKRGREPQRSLPHWFVEVQINGGKKRKMLLDTGASGLLVAVEVGKKDGVETIVESHVRGAGDEGARKAWLGWAEKVAIGEVTLGNCLIALAQRRTWHGNADGIIGTDVFDDFRITLDLPHSVLSLERLPEQPDRFCCDAASESGDGFTKIRLLGSRILTPGVINDQLAGYFLIDTGAEQSLIDDEPAAASTKTRSTPFGLRGISGKVKGVKEASEIVLQFAGVRQKHEGMLSMDMADLSDSFGTELKALIGCSLLEHTVLTIDYRNAFIKVKAAQ